MDGEAAGESVCLERASRAAGPLEIWFLRDGACWCDQCWQHQGQFRQGTINIGPPYLYPGLISCAQELRTNVGSRRGHPLGTYTEAVYTAASPILDGQPLLKAQEMGGFCLGSTVVLVFEAPQDFNFFVKNGQKVKVGEALGEVAPLSEESKKDR